MTLSAMLDDCLQRLQAGETIAACLARYPDRARELAPLLAAAASLRPLAAQRLSEQQRMQGRAAVRAAARTNTARRVQAADRPSSGGWLVGRGLPATALVVLVLFALATTTVLASQPGDVGYALRVVVERAPTVLRTSPSGRATAELVITDRRLADLEGHLRSTRRIETAALAALVRGDEAAARRVLHLPEAERLRVAERIERHAFAVSRLAAQADRPEAAAYLLQVARRIERVANRLRLGLPLPARPGSALEAPDAADPSGPVVWTPTPTATAPAATSTPPDQDRSPTATVIAGEPSQTPEEPDPTPELDAEPEDTPTESAPSVTSTPTSGADGTPPAQVSLTPATPATTATALPTRTPRPPLTPLPTRTPRPPLTPLPTRTPRPPLTPLPTRTPRPPLTPLPPTSEPANGTPTPGPQWTPASTQAPTPVTPVASPTVGAAPTSMVRPLYPPRPTRPPGS